VKDKIFSDLVDVALYKSKMESCMPTIERAIASVPSDWKYIDSDAIDAVDIDFDSKRRVLERFRCEEFWELK
jgi:hypothetical protein